MQGGVLGLGPGLRVALGVGKGMRTTQFRDLRGVFGEQLLIGRSEKKFPDRVFCGSLRRIYWHVSHHCTT